MSGTVGLMTWASLLLGVVLAVRGDIHAGVVYLVLFYAAQVSAQLIESFMQVRNLSRGSGRASKLVALVRTPPEVVDAPGASALVVTAGAVRFEAVQFSYLPDRPLLADFDLELAPVSTSVSLARRGAGSPPSPGWFCASWTLTAVASWSTARILPAARRPACAGRCIMSPRTPRCCTGRSPRTSGTGKRARSISSEYAGWQRRHT